jgi:hypothetical protein
MLIFIFIFYLGIFILGISMFSDSKALSVTIIENIAWITIFIILIVGFFKHFLKVSIVDILKFDWLKMKPVDSTKPTTDTIPTTTDLSNNIIDKKEVFNISNNLYTYDDAQAICKSYGAELATYDDIEKSYNNGGEWCNYGWSANQMILFPTQKTTWAKLHESEKNKNNCGRPGVNGGYIANPYAKFGVNCYGKKPNQTDADKVRMNANQSIVPISDEDKKINEKVNFWKENGNKFLVLNPFNRSLWNEK